MAGRRREEDRAPIVHRSSERSSFVFTMGEYKESSPSGSIPISISFPFPSLPFPSLQFFQTISSVFFFLQTIVGRSGSIPISISLQIPFFRGRSPFQYRIQFLRGRSPFQYRFIFNSNSSDHLSAFFFFLQTIISSDITLPRREGFDVYRPARYSVHRLLSLRIAHSPFHSSGGGVVEDGSSPSGIGVSYPPPYLFIIFPPPMWLLLIFLHFLTSIGGRCCH